MKKIIKKFFVILLFIVLSLTLIGCESGQVDGKVEYYLTPTETEITVTIGETVQIEYDTNITAPLTFESFDEEIASVDETGLVTTHKTGTATIYVYYGICEFEVIITVKSKPATVYTITIDGYDVIETTRTGVAIKYFLEQEYGSKMHPSFGNYIFDGYYTDKECTKELNLMTKLSQSITIYPKLTLDTTKCDLMFELGEVILEGDEIKINNNIIAITPDYGTTVKANNENYENCDLIEVRYDYTTYTHKITNVYTQGNKSEVVIPYDGYIIALPKNYQDYANLSQKLTKNTNIATDRYSIIVANRIYVNRESEKTTQETIKASVICSFSSAYDFTNQQYLFQLRADDKAYPASTTKIITALAALQNAPLDLEITVGDELDFMYEGSSPGTAGSKKGQVWTLRQLLYAMLLPSGNDSAYTIAAGVARSLPGNENKPMKELLEIFAGLMNEVRDQVGATNSNFMVPDGNSYYDNSKPNGWDDRLTYHYVTANDMIKFAALGFNYPALAKVTSTVSKSFKIVSGQSFSFTNTNNLINPSSTNYYKYAVGMKTGTTTPGGQCLIFGAEVEGRFVIGAVLKSSNGNRYNDALAILNQIFKK